MKKTFKIEVDCANCAAKMEQAVKSLPGVSAATVSFMTQKMVVEAADEGFDALMEQVVRACKKIEPDCEVYL
ncbi:MAG TPA: cation transporter [Candidatus Fournierella merdigallinarum]|nr:cation transporter [Candidatus Fournierella merdigallinarum]